jgi:hypothetical protein
VLERTYTRRRKPWETAGENKFLYYHFGKELEGSPKSKY